MRRVRPRPIFAWSSGIPVVAPCLQTPPAPTPGPHLPPLTPTLSPLPRPRPQLPALFTSGSCLPSIPHHHLLPPLATLPSVYGDLAPPMPTLPPMASLQQPALPSCSHLPPPPSLPSATIFQMPPQIPMPGSGPNLPPTLPPAPFTLLRSPSNPMDKIYAKVCFPR